MPASVPVGMRLELSRARIVDGKDGEFEDWMDMLNSRPDELQEGLPAERVVLRLGIHKAPVSLRIFVRCSCRLEHR